MTPPRLDNWPSLLADYIESRRTVPFAWGQQDCSLFAADGVRAIRGDDPGASWRGRYHTALGALRALGGSWSRLLELPGESGFAEIPLLAAGRGDLVAIEQSGRPSLGLHLGHVLAAAGPTGLEFLSPPRAVRAWRV